MKNAKSDETVRLRSFRARAFALLPLVFVSMPAPVRADQLTCPKAMSPVVEARLLQVLNATAIAIREDNWFDKSYEASLDALLIGKDKVSIETRVALMDYPIAAAYSEELLCVVSTGGQKALHFLQLYSQCDIAPSHSPVPRDHSRELRSLTLKAWKATTGRGSCESA